MTPQQPFCKQVFITHSADETMLLGYTIGCALQSGDVIAFRGTLGAGKTTMTKGIARALGITETITSPTFCLVSEYSGKMTLYHIDAYRLDGADDFEGIGADDMLYGSGVCAVEWSENAAGALPDDAIQIEITPLNYNDRKIEVRGWKYGAISNESVSD